jgi:hypothetical protein
MKPMIVSSFMKKEGFAFYIMTLGTSTLSSGMT